MNDHKLGLCVIKLVSVIEKIIAWDNSLGPEAKTLLLSELSEALTIIGENK